METKTGASDNVRKLDKTLLRLERNYAAARTAPAVRSPCRPRGQRGAEPSLRRTAGTAGCPASQRRAHLSRPVGQSDEVPLGGPRHDDDLLRQLLLPDLPEGGHGGGLPLAGLLRRAASRPPLPASGGAASCSGAERNGVVRSGGVVRIGGETFACSFL